MWFKMNTRTRLVTATTSGVRANGELMVNQLVNPSVHSNPLFNAVEELVRGWVKAAASDRRIDVRVLPSDNIVAVCRVEDVSAVMVFQNGWWKGNLQAHVKWAPGQVKREIVEWEWEDPLLLDKMEAWFWAHASCLRCSE